MINSWEVCDFNETNTMNDKSANLPDIYHNVVKREIHPLFDFHEFFILLIALVLADLLAHHSVYCIIDRRN